MCVSVRVPECAWGVEGEGGAGETSSAGVGWKFGLYLRGRGKERKGFSREWSDQLHAFRKGCSGCSLEDGADGRAGRKVLR